MPKVDNLTAEGISMLRWRSLPRSCVWVDPQGRQVQDVPAHVAYSDIAKSLADQGSLRIEGYHPAGTVKVFIAGEEAKVVGGALIQPPHEAARGGTVSGERRDKRPRRQER